MEKRIRPRLRASIITSRNGVSLHLSAFEFIQKNNADIRKVFALRHLAQRNNRQPAHDTTHLIAQE
jgi:hypothetical protein